MIGLYILAFLGGLLAFVLLSVIVIAAWDWFMEVIEGPSHIRSIRLRVIQSDSKLNAISVSMHKMQEEINFLKTKRDKNK